MVAIDCWLPDGECRRSVKSVNYPVILAHVMDQRIAYLQGWREDEIVSVCVCVCVCVCWVWCLMYSCALQGIASLVSSPNLLQLSFAKRLLRPLHHISSERSYRSELQNHNVCALCGFSILYSMCIVC